MAADSARRLALWTAAAVLGAVTLVLAVEGPAPPAAPTAPAAPAVAPAAAAPATPPAPAPPPAPPSPVNSIRNKISAGDLLSAESILEVHRAANGEDAAYLSGLAWLARGALLLGDLDKAERYAADARRRCAEAKSRDFSREEDHAAEIAFGTAIEVETQLLARLKGPKKAVEHLRGELAGIKGPVALRSRLNKRLNLMTMEGTPAPELAIDDFIGDRPPALAALRGKPVVLFLWAEWCGDCKNQAGALARAVKRHATDGVQFVALTRYYDEAEKRPAEKERVAGVWTSSYAEVGALPIVFSTASMERYGGSSTPTFVFIDRAGVVRRYTPTRLTEDELERSLAVLLR